MPTALRRPCVSGVAWRGVSPLLPPPQPPRRLAQAPEQGTRGRREEPGRRRASLRPDLTACSLQPAPPFDLGLREGHPGPRPPPAVSAVGGRSPGVRVADCCPLQKPGGLPRPAIALASGTEAHPMVHPLSRGRAQLRLFSRGSLATQDCVTSARASPDGPAASPCGSTSPSLCAGPGC